MRNGNLKILARVAMLVAIEIVLTRFLSIQSPMLRIGFGFLPVAVCAMLYGPGWAAAGYVVGDIVGMMFSAAAFMPGITLSKVLTGLVFGLLLYRQNENDKFAWWRPLTAAAINAAVIGLCVNTYWLSALFATPYWTVFAARLVQTAVQLPLEFIGMLALIKPVGLLRKHNLA
ncbi:membrane protein [Clostridia bacterium]|nr:membrane protein [Clostridia bacterium]